MKISVITISQFLAVLIAGIALDCHADLASSIKSGNLVEIQQYLSANTTLVNARVVGDFRPLQLAIDAKQEKAAKLLIENGANIRTVCPDGSTLLHHAASLGEKDVVELLIKHGAEVNAYWGGHTPLELAAESGNLNVAEILVKNGAKVQVPNVDQMLSAIAYNQIGVAKLLIVKGAICNYRNTNGRTYLHTVPGYATQDLHTTDADFVDLLVSCGVNVNATDNVGNTPLHVMTDFGDKGVTIAKRLVALGANVNAVNKEGRTPLLEAAFKGRGNAEFARLLIDHGADVTVKDKYGASLLHYLAFRTNPASKDIAEVIISKGADVHAKAKLTVNNYEQSMDGYTPLHLAAISGQVELGQLLISNGADIAEATSTLQTPLSFAIENSNTDFASMLISKGANVNGKDKRLLTPLNIAIATNNVDAVELLIEKGADINGISGEDGATPLLRAVQMGNLGIARILVEKGSDVNLKDDSGMTPLHWAAKEGRTELAEFLIFKGADVNARDKKDITPIRLAPREIIELLVAHGANPSAKTDQASVKLACKFIIDHANNGQLRYLTKETYQGQEFVADIPEVVSGEELGSINNVRLTINGEQYILGLADLSQSEQRPVYLAMLDANDTTETLCMFGREDGVATNANKHHVYYVITKGELAISDLLHQQLIPPANISPLPFHIPKDLVKGAEIQVVTGYQAEGTGSTKSKAATVTVQLNRPGKQIVLVLNSVHPVSWLVEATAETKLQGIVLSPQDTNSTGLESSVHSNVKSRIYKVSLPSVPSSDSPEFLKMLWHFNAWFSITRLNYLYIKRVLPLTIDLSQSESDDPNLELDYPPVQNAPTRMIFDLHDRRLQPVAWSLKGVSAGKKSGPKHLYSRKFSVVPNGREAYILANDQLVMLDTETGATSQFAMPPDFPAMSAASDITYDTSRDVVSVISQGGYIYRFDAKSQRWLDYYSVGRYDVLSLAYDRVLDQHLAWTGNGELLSISSTGGVRAKYEVASKLAGYTRLYGVDHVMEIHPHGKHVALVGFKGGEVSSIWYYNIDSRNAILTYKRNGP